MGVDGGVVRYLSRLVKVLRKVSRVERRSGGYRELNDPFIITLGLVLLTN